jgi:hypothetical protein
MDAVADRDFACEVLAALAILGMHILTVERGCDFVGIGRVWIFRPQ